MPACVNGSQPATAGAVAVTGASGFIGSALVRALAVGGGPVIGLCRDPVAQPRLDHVEWRPYSLARRFDPAVLHDVRVLIHCAYAAHVPGGPDVVALNVDAAAALHTATRAQGETHFVYISSLSAIQGGTSRYGRQKRAIEQLCDPTRDLVIRPGLVLGHGGLAQALVAQLTSRRIVPLVGGGRQPVYALGIEALCDAVTSAIRRGITGSYAVACPEPLTLRALAERIASAAGAHPRFLPVPEWPVRVAARTAERLGVPFPFSTDQIEGLRHLARHDISADLAALGVVPRPIDDTVAQLWPK